jgi:4'-phosphopantetheinyl transferase
VGIDIEHKARKADWQGIGKRFFTKLEQQALFSLDNTTQQEAFFDLWTRKEAYMKVLGCGLALSPTQFSVSVAPQPPALLEHYSDKFKPDTEVIFKTISLPEDLAEFSATAAVRGEFEEYKIIIPLS